MTTREIAEAFTALCRDGKGDEAAARFWSDGVVSIEAMDGPMARLEGREAVLAKHRWWDENTEFHGGSVEGPWVNGDQFAVRFTMDVTMKGQGRSQSAEIAVYTVRDGKVVEERFFY